MQFYVVYSMQLVSFWCLYEITGITNCGNLYLSMLLTKFVGYQRVQLKSNILFPLDYWQQHRNEKVELQYLLKNSQDKLEQQLKVCNDQLERLARTDMLVKDLYVENSYLIANVQRLEQRCHMLAQCNSNSSSVWTVPCFWLCGMLIFSSEQISTWWCARVIVRQVWIFICSTKANCFIIYVCYIVWSELWLISKELHFISRLLNYYYIKYYYMRCCNVSYLQNIFTLSVEFSAPFSFSWMKKKLVNCLIKV